MRGITLILATKVEGADKQSDFSVHFSEVGNEPEIRKIAQLREEGYRIFFVYGDARYIIDDIGGVVR